jgi:DNA-binding IclR family transcriptional regulator
MEPGLVSVAAPVRDPQGRIVAAFNVSAPKYRFEAGVDQVGAALIAVAGELGSALRGERPTDLDEGG